MAKLSVNKIWKTYIEPTGVSMKEWYGKELDEYNSKKEKKELKSEFDVWLNRKYKLNGAKSYENLIGKTKVIETIQPITEMKDLKPISLAIGQATEKQAPPKPSNPVITENKNAKQDIPEIKKRILGMPPALTWGLGITAVIALSYVGIKIFAKKS